jgi:ABC-type uncharacterized transport system substrate-binding protein
MLDKPPTKTDLSLLARFAAIVGEKYTITDPQAQAPYLIEQRNLYHGRTPMVLRPASVAERLPLISLFGESAKTGGLLAYGPNLGEMFRRSGEYVGKILQGAKPSDLPIRRPEKFDLVINLKTAAALGVTVPPLLLATADEVIE